MSCKAPGGVVAPTERLALASERGRLIYGGDRVFLGSLDDSVSRHPWSGYRPSLPYLNKRLVDSVLFGAPVSMRVGNLLFQDEYLQALLHPHLSPLVELAKVGFVQFQMNSDTINASIAQRVESRTQSALEMQAKHFWYHTSDSYAALAKLDQQLTPGLGKLRYAPSFNAYFRAIMRESADTATPAFQRVYERWKDRPATVEAAGAQEEGVRTRDWFERDAREIFDNDLALVREAMWVANAANHYAYSLQFVGQAGTAPMVETTQFDRHAEVCATRHALPTELAQELLAKNKLSDPLNVALSIISVPPAAYDPANAGILANLARRFPNPEDSPLLEKQRRDFRLAKDQLTLAISAYLENPAPSAVEPIRAHALAYDDALGQAFGRSRNRSIGLYCRMLGRRTRSEAPEALVQGLIGMAAGNIGGLVLGVAIAIAGVRFVPSWDALSRLRRSPDNPLEIGDPNEEPERTREKIAASAYLRYGSYVGVRTLNTEKAMRFRAMLTPD